MTDEPLESGPLPAGREPMRRPSSIVISMVLLALWWAYTIVVAVTLLGAVGGAGNWLALACCTAAAAAVLRGLWHGGPTAWRVVHGFAAPVAVAFLVGAGIMLLFGPRLGSLITPPVDLAFVAATAGGLLAVLALLVSGLLVRTAPARAWCGRR
ncbi:hypothetical protein F6X68_10245 [Micromonospora sp. AMSO12t]|uniref:hypothetical protein n=1 Tax=unclassified Micromonospora TaxID=2617518 RepID=UPI00124AF6A1|nr:MULTISPECIES: hypothetical protein [unclassified Micromonospora]KAB1158759.1 hypothetical protein F6X68_10245 [Micromonospora sp. AMSO12t]WSG01913.1 hypothetical protein OG989_30445 [Micromonospora sp. NBC_01740]